MKTINGHITPDVPRNRSGGLHSGELTKKVDSPRLIHFEDFIRVFKEKEMSLRQQLRFIKQHQSDVIDIEDSHSLTDHFVQVANELYREVSNMGPYDGDDAIAGIDYPYSKNNPRYKKGDIIINPRIFEHNITPANAEPTEFCCFRSARKLTDDNYKILQCHLVEMARIGLCLEDQLSKWLYFLGATPRYDDQAQLNEKLLFLGSVKVLKFWIRALYGLMSYQLPIPSAGLPAGCYQLSPVIITPNGSGVRPKSVSGEPTTRDPFVHIVASSVRLLDRDLQVRSFTTTLEPTINEAATILLLLQPLGCHLVA